jgi:uncharacterized Zn ribbon protein
MPHDINGQLLAEGDFVVIVAKVKQVHATAEYCNLSLETVEAMYPGEHKSALTLNSKQVTKIPA